ncbi:hypothetical protein CYMTET_18891, partial [Cymbomonas tetramitiformis]
MQVEFFNVHNKTISVDTANDLRNSCKWNVCMRDELRVAKKLPEVCWYENDQSFTHSQYQHVEALSLRQGEWYIRVLEDHYQAVRGRIKQVSDDKTMFDIPTLPRWETCLKDASSSSSPEPPRPVSPLSPYPYSFKPPLPQLPPPTVLTPSSEDTHTSGNSSKAIDNITFSPTMVAVPFMWSVDVSMPIDLQPVGTGAQYMQGQWSRCREVCEANEQCNAFTFQYVYSWCFFKMCFNANASSWWENKGYELHYMNRDRCEHNDEGAANDNDLQRRHLTASGSPTAAPSAPPISVAPTTAAPSTAAPTTAPTTGSPTTIGSGVSTSGLKAWFKMENWSAEDNTWPDTTGAYVATILSGSVTTSESGGNGAAIPVRSLTGDSTTQVSFGAVLESTHTLCSLTRYTGGVQNRILQGSAGNFLHGHWKSRSGVAHNQNWRTFSFDNVGSSIAETAKTDWVPICSQEGGDDLVNVNGYFVNVATGAGYSSDFDLVINTGADPSEISDFAVSEVITWNRALTRSEMTTAMKYLRSRLGRIGAQPAISFDHMRTGGYCSNGKYADGPSTLIGCKAKCASEAACAYFAVKESVNCRVFYSDANYCSAQTSESDTELYRKVMLRSDEGAASTLLYADSVERQFTGSDTSTVTLSHVPNPLASSARTFMLLFNTTVTVPYTTLLGTGTAATKQMFNLQVHDGCMAIIGYNYDFRPSCSIPYADGAYHHLAVTFDGNTVKLYFDGELVASEPGWTGYATTGHANYLGRSTHTGYEQYATGHIKGVEIHSAALTAAQIAHAAGKATYTVDGGAATTNADAYTQIATHSICQNTESDWESVSYLEATYGSVADGAAISGAWAVHSSIGYVIYNVQSVEKCAAVCQAVAGCSYFSISLTEYGYGCYIHASCHSGYNMDWDYQVYQLKPGETTSSPTISPTTSPTSSPTIGPGDCTLEALGMQSGAILNSQISSSGSFASRNNNFDYCTMTSGRLGASGASGEGINNHGAWCATSSDGSYHPPSATSYHPRQWLQMDLLMPIAVVAVATQKRNDANQYLTEFTVSASMDGISWTQVSDASGSLIFTGNSNSDPPAEYKLNYFNFPVTAQLFRLYPRTFYGHYSVRMEFFRCAAAGVVTQSIAHLEAPLNIRASSSSAVKTTLGVPPNVPRDATAVVASIYAYASQSDHVVHTFGRNNDHYKKPWGNNVYTRNEYMNDVMIVVNGEDADRDYYGFDYGNHIIPLDADGNIRAFLCAGHTYGTHYVVLTVHSYIPASSDIKFLDLPQNIRYSASANWQSSLAVPSNIPAGATAVIATVSTYASTSGGSSVWYSFGRNNGHFSDPSSNAVYTRDEYFNDVLITHHSQDFYGFSHGAQIIPLDSLGAIQARMTNYDAGDHYVTLQVFGFVAASSAVSFVTLPQNIRISSTTEEERALDLPANIPATATAVLSSITTYDTLDDHVVHTFGRH